MQRRGIVNSLVAAVAILITGGLAAQAVVRGPSTSADSELVAAGVDGRGAFAVDPQAATNDTRPTANTQPRPLPRLTTTTPQAPVTTATALPVPPETTVPPVTVPSIPPPPPDVNRPVPPPPPPPPPVVIQTGPASWSFEDKGITITASVSPVAPRVGDTITISFTTGGEGENCCRAVVFVGAGADMKMIGDTLRSEADPCQPSPVTSGSGSLVVSEPGSFSFDVQATRDPAGCAGPFEFTNVGLSATVEVLPALPAA